LGPSHLILITTHKAPQIRPIENWGTKPGPDRYSCPEYMPDKQPKREKRKGCVAGETCCGQGGTVRGSEGERLSTKKRRFISRTGKENGDTLEFGREKERVKVQSKKKNLRTAICC